MKKYLLLLLFFYINFSSAQSIQAIDSLNNEICKSLEQNKNLNDQIRINTINNRHIIPYLSKFKDSIVQIDAFKKIYFRLQKNCNAFVLLSQANSAKKDTSIVSEIPKKIISSQECDLFNKNQNYYYLEQNGDKIEVTLKDNLWIEKFSDNTFSKLYYRKKGNCEFELEFIESSNLSRGNFSIKGDKYLYHLYAKENNSYHVYLQNKETYYTFTLIKE